MRSLCVSWGSAALRPDLSAETFPLVSKQRHRDIRNLHSAKDQCWRMLTRVRNSSTLFFFSRSVVEQEEVSSSDFKKSESSSTVVDLKGHFATYLCSLKYLQPSRISDESRTSFAPFDAV